MKKRFFCITAMFATIFSLTSCNVEQHDLETIVVKEPTCVEDGEGYQRCKKCGEESDRIVIPALGHNYYVRVKAPTCLEDGYTLKNCTRCGEEQKLNETAALGHNIVDYHVDADCENPGFIHHQCTNCDYSYEDNQCDPLGHDYIVTSQELTCTDDQFIKKVCKRCNYTKIENYQKAPGHDYEILIDIKPTCENDGLIKRKCKVCDYEYEEVISALGHDIIKHEEKPASCTEDGHSQYEECSRGDYCTTKEFYEKTGHNYISYEVAPTCLERGYTLHQCLNCGDSYKDCFTAEPKGHDLIHHEGKNPTCDKGGYLPYDTCKNCSYTTYKGLEALSTEHNYEKKVIEATTYSEGYIYNECTNCHDIVIETYIPAISSDRLIDTKPNILNKNAYSQSFRNDDDNFFVINIGKIQDLVLHKFVNFYWNENVEEMESYPKQIITPEVASLQEIYEKSIEKSAINIKSILYNSNIDAFKNGFTISKINDNSLDEESGNIIKNKYNKEAFEIDNNYAWLRQKISSLRNSFSIEKEKYKYNKQYAYCAVVDVDVYIGVKYDISANKAYYKMYTSFDGDVVEKIFASDKDDIGNVTNSFNLEKTIAREISRTPDDYITNHPKKTASKAIAENANTKYEVKSFHTFYIDFSSDVFNEYYNLGYDMYSLKIEYRFRREKGNAKLYFQVTTLDHNIGLSSEVADKNADSDGVSITEKNISNLANEKGFSVIFNNRNINSYFIVYFKVTFTFYCSRAIY